MGSLDRDLSGEPYSLLVKLDEPVTLGEAENRFLLFKNYSFDPSLSPAGKTVVSASIYSSYSYWEQLSRDKDRYRAEKERIAALVIRTLEKRWPGAAVKVEVADVATPVTYHRYTGVWKGAYMSWIVPPGKGMLHLSKSLPGLDRFYLIGQWTEPPAGLPGSMLTGRHVMQIICRKDKKPFLAGPREA